MRPFRFRLKNRLALSDKPLTLGEEIDSSSSNNTITDNHNSVNVQGFLSVSHKEEVVNKVIL